MWAALAAYAVLVNIAAYGAFLLDKRRARQGGWRVGERTLLWLSGAGGSLGAVAAQRQLRHKTRKQPFATYLRLIVGIQAAVLSAAVVVLIARSS